MNTVLSLFFYTTPLCFETSASSCKRASRLSLGFGFGSRSRGVYVSACVRACDVLYRRACFFFARRSWKRKFRVYKSVLKRRQKYTRERHERKSNEVGWFISNKKYDDEFSLSLSLSLSARATQNDDARHARTKSTKKTR